MERSVANIRVRTAGTLGGNLCFSDPHSDPATFLLAAGAEAVIRRGGEPERSLPLDQFLRGPYETALAEGDLLVAIRMPAAPRDGHRAPQARIPRAAGGDRRDLGARGRGRVERGADRRRLGRPARGARGRGGSGAWLAGAAGEDVAAAAAGGSGRRRGDANGSPEYKRQLVRVLVTRALREREWRAPRSGDAH